MSSGITANRMILKSRQIGATWYFAREALLDALRDDVKYPYQRNQIFLSASRRQAHQFKGFIQQAALEVDVELKGGDKIILSNGARAAFSGDVSGDGAILYGQPEIR
ncbi:Phage terminase ATPase subunit [Salmonella bongori N268-08]|uniref:Phage terminase ATPase subunit n=1 Tax=Salmonella bongori N268-08 TaxID=1197719 RepID=S5MV49_SALBN|nr:Phage terminase ATPase subunit [Salmonella bongori N268-08]